MAQNASFISHAIYSVTRLLINSCSVHNALANLLDNLFCALLFVPYCLFIYVSLFFSVAFQALLKMDTLQGCFSNYGVPFAMKVITIRAPFRFSESKAQNSSWTVQSDRWIVIAAHSSGSFMTAGKCIRRNLKISCGRTEKTSWTEKKLSKSILASIYCALSSGLCMAAVMESEGTTV